jgi:superfamily II DNA or RNA helicase
VDGIDVTCFDQAFSMSSLPLEQAPGLPAEVAIRAAEAAKIPVELLEDAVAAALAPGGPDGVRRRWRAAAACAGTDGELFYPGRGQSMAAAVATCVQCPVRALCLGEALYSGDHFGIWGGVSERARRQVRRVLREAGIMGVVGEAAYTAWDEAEIEPHEEPDLHVVHEPWPHQLEAVEAVAAEIGDGGRCQVAMATASGKTLVAVWAAQEMSCRRVLVLVPNLGLVPQTAQVWLDYFPGAATLAVCSDAGEVALELNATTDVDAVRDFMLDAGLRPALVFGTYASSAVLAEAGVPFDLIVCDEAHVLTGAVDKKFSAVARGEIPTARTLYMTATPRRWRKRADVEVVSMDEDGPFGRRVYDFKLSDAVERGIIADYRVVVAAVERSVFERVAAHPDLTGIDPHLLAGAIAVVRAMADGDMRSCISFHNLVERARTFARLIGPVAELLDERPPVPGWAGFVHGGASVRIRRRLLARLADRRTWSVLANARSLGLGIDVPHLDSVSIVDPRQSEVDILQASGRALRRPNRDKVGTIILPVLLTGELDPDDPLAGCDERSLDLVANVLRALRAHDDGLGTRLDKLRRNQLSPNAVGRHHPNLLGSVLRGRAARGLLRSRVELRVPGGPTGELAGALALHLVRESTSTWDDSFALLQAYVATHGSARVPQGTKVPTATGTYNLGQWCSVQRALYRRGLLGAERATALEGLHQWAWDPREQEWWDKLDALRDYVVTHDNQYPPYHGGAWRVLHNGVRVASFMTTCRQARKGWLTKFPDRLAAIEALPRWSWNTKDDEWERSFTRLERWLAATGGDWPTNGNEVDGQDIGRWVGKQRARIKAEQGQPYDRNKTSALSPERTARLRALPGWTDDGTLFRQDQWATNLERLRRFVAAHGRTPTQVEDFEGVRLGAWVAKQRARYHGHRLSPGRMARLEAVPGFQWHVKDRWEDRYQSLLRYAAAHPPVNGQLRLRNEPWEGVSLTNWCTTQRMAYGKGDLDPERVARLEAVPGWSWDVWGDRRERTLAAIEAWYGRESRDPPRSHREAGVPIRNWIEHYRASPDVTDAERARLEAIPNWSWSARRSA